MVTETVLVQRENSYPPVPANPPEVIIGAAAGVVLRYARDDDAAAIIAMISAVWSEYPGKILVAATDMPELLQPATSYARHDGRFWVVEANGRIIGTIALQPSAEPGVVELQKLYVARDMRQNGLGGFLCHLVEQEASQRGAHAVELWSDVKLLDAHRRYERLGYHRGETLKSYNDTSGTVRYYYRKALNTELPNHQDVTRDGSPDLGDRWQGLLYPGAGGSTLEPDGIIMKYLSFTAHPASVGENYFQHLCRAAGFAVKMIRGGFACLVHAALPFLFVHTGSGVVADLNTRMITSRRRQNAPRPVAKTSRKRITAA
jgi:putative acetyltransferase